jgi:hypothetical protein
MDNIDMKLRDNSLIFERKNLDWLWFGLVFLFALNFLAKPNHLLLSVFFIGIIVTIYKKSTFKVTIDLLLIWLFSLSYFILLTYHGRGGIGAMLIYMIGPVGSFFIGYCIVKSNNKFIFKTVMAIVFGNFIHGLLNMTTYFRLYGFTSSVIGARALPDIWTGVSLSATLQGTYYTLIASLLFYSLVLLINKKRKGLAIAIILSIVFSLLATFVMGNRTLIAIMLIAFLSNFLLYSALTRKSPKHITKSIAYIAILALGIYVIYTKNIFGIREFVEGSTWYMRSNIMAANEDPRIVLYQRAISQMFDFPFGGYKMNLLTNSYVHNLWLDVLYATGLIPFFFLIIYTFKSITSLIRLIKQKNTDVEFKIFIFSIYTGFFLNFMVEPILEGVPYMFLSFCIINGMIRKQLDLYKQSNCLK